jgi:hypothetical protein
LRALVVFSDGVPEERHVLARFLKKGFRHVFVCVVMDGHWILLDGCGPLPQIRYLSEESFALAEHYMDQGARVVETAQGDKHVRCPMINANCVGFVKYFLCIRAPFVLTPWQLYKHLRK